MPPSISVVTPTHNRLASLLRLLHSIASDMENVSIEMIVVDDGSTDGSAASIPSRIGCLDVRVITQPQSGPATARNTGAAAAHADILLFLDDDVELAAGSVRAHEEFHQTREGDVALGALPFVETGDSFFGIILRGWGSAMRDGIARPGYRYNFRDLMTGHFSIRRSDFERLGGFDPAFWCHEDWEFGYRAIAAGLDMGYLPSAVAMHYDATGVSKSLRRKFDEGVADVQLVRKHPELLTELPLGWTGYSRRERALRSLAERRSSLGDAAVRASLRLLTVWEALTLRFRWRSLLERALLYWYWRGVATAMPGQPGDSLTPAATADACMTETSPLASRASAGAEPCVTVDLQHGIETAAAQLDRLRPRTVVLAHGREIVATVPLRAGYERLCGGHLRRLLARDYALPYERALGRAGLIPPILAPAALEHDDAPDDTPQRSTAA